MRSSDLIRENQSVRTGGLEVGITSMLLSACNGSQKAAFVELLVNGCTTQGIRVSGNGVRLVGRWPKKVLECHVLQLPL